MENEVKKAVEILRNGGVFLYPTDTVWGIGCDATQAEAVNRIYNIKQRDDSKSMLLLVNSADMIYDYVREIPEIALELVSVAVSPLTIIYYNAYNLPQNLIGADGTIGIRVTTDKFCAEVIRRLGKPIVSTSANLSGQPTPAIFTEIQPEIKQSVDYVVNWRQNDLTRARPSEIIKIGAGGVFEIIRK